MQGIIADDYTDLLANPARERFWRKKQLTGRIGAYGYTSGAGYSAGRTPLFLLVEGSASRDSYVSVNHYSFGYSSSYENLYENRSDNYNYSAVALSGFGSDSFGIGFGVYYDASHNRYKNDSSIREAEVASIGGPIVYLDTSEYGKNTVTSVKAPHAVLGLHWRQTGTVQVDRDLLFKLSMKENIVEEDAYRNSYTDLDPDGDGFAQRYGSSPTTISGPSVSSYRDFCNARQKPRYNYGGGVEYRKKKAGDNARTGYLVSFSWEPQNTQRYNSRAHVVSYSVSSATVTSSSSATYRVDKGENYSYGAVVGAGWMWKMNEKFWMGFGLRGDATYRKQTYQSEVSSYYSIYTLALASERTFSSRIGLPISAEMQVASGLSFRGNITYLWDYSITKKTLDSGYFPRKNVTGINSHTNTGYGAGMNYHWRNLDVDLFTSGDLATLYGYTLQIGYKFM